MSGISKAKGRRNSKSKRAAKFQLAPAKAGRRKVYGDPVVNAKGVIVSGRRKTKKFPDGKDKYGNVCFTMDHTVRFQHNPMPDRWFG